VRRPSAWKWVVNVVLSAPAGVNAVRTADGVQVCATGPALRTGLCDSANQLTGPYANVGRNGHK